MTFLKDINRVEIGGVISEVVLKDSQSRRGNVKDVLKWWNPSFLSYERL
jgi:hypothetical protein|tara:strand:- start:575 stop:721 length:147 start_codon:yes stop_codon:yes gene_type:complete